MALEVLGRLAYIALGFVLAVYLFSIGVM